MSQGTDGTVLSSVVSIHVTIVTWIESDGRSWGGFGRGGWRGFFGGEFDLKRRDESEGADADLRPDFRDEKI